MTSQAQWAEKEKAVATYVWWVAQKERYAEELNARLLDSAMNEVQAEAKRKPQPKQSLKSKLDSSNTMNALETQVLKQLDNLTTIAKLLVKYDFKETGSLNLGKDEPEIFFFCYDTNRESILALVADQVGKEGWKRDLVYHGRSDNWTKIVDGVSLIISEAELIPQPTKPTEVSPKDFPLMLEAPAFEEYNNIVG
jgi:hypothetical protein